MNVEQARFNMIEQQIRPWDVLDANVLALLALVKREDFVPAGLRTLAFVDEELPLGDGEFMLAPRVEARLLQEAGVLRHERVLEVGTGSGFMAALLSHRAQSVLTLEDKPALAAQASKNLRRAGVHAATVREADGRHGAAADGPFDVIVLSGSVHTVPQALLQQLKIGGRLVAIVGDEPVMCALRVLRRADARFEQKTLFDTVAPRLRGFEAGSRFQF